MGASRIPPTEPVAAALFGAARQAVLRLFFGHADERFYQRQIVRELGLGSGAVQRELGRLTRCGILTRVVDGRQTYYQANRECPVFDELCGLVRKTFGVAGVLQTALAPLAEQIRIAFIYGSIARGGETADSDVDVMVVGDAIRPAEMYAAIRPAQQELRREVNLKVYHTEEFCRKLTAGQHFLSSVVASPKILIIGDPHELAKLAEIRVAQATSSKSAG